MKKKTKKKDDGGMSMVMSEPSPAKRRRWAAESMARAVMETDPTIKRRENAITKAVLSAATKASTSARQD